MDTPIIAMTKRAVDKASNHAFHALSSKDYKVPVNLLSHTVCSLWKSSVDVSHWAFLQVEAVPRQVWLPPYQFDKPKAWLDNVDRIIETQRQLEMLRLSEPIQSAPEHHRFKPLMVTPQPETAANQADSKRFSVYVDGDRFRKIVSGHAVRGRPLCPASVYLECITMAISTLINDDLQQSGLEFENLNIQSPMGTATRNVEVLLSEILGESRWDFSVISRSEGALSKTTVHAKGQVTRTTDLKAWRNGSAHQPEDAGSWRNQTGGDDAIETSIQPLLPCCILRQLLQGHIEHLYLGHRGRCQYRCSIRPAWYG